MVWFIIPFSYYVSCLIFFVLFSLRALEDYSTDVFVYAVKAMREAQGAILPEYGTSVAGQNQ